MGFQKVSTIYSGFTVRSSCTLRKNCRYKVTFAHAYSQISGVAAFVIGQYVVLWLLKLGMLLGFLPKVLLPIVHKEIHLHLQVRMCPDQFCV